MIFTKEIKELLELANEELLVKDDKGKLSKAEAGKKGEIVTSDQIDDIIIEKLFGKTKLGSTDYRDFLKIVKLVESAVGAPTVSRIKKEKPKGQGTGNG